MSELKIIIYVNSISEILYIQHLNQIIIMPRVVFKFVEFAYLRFLSCTSMKATCSRAHRSGPHCRMPTQTHTKERSIYTTTTTESKCSHTLPAARTLPRAPSENRLLEQCLSCFCFFALNTLNNFYKTPKSFVLDTLLFL